jgi:hypothetical protein
LGIDPAVFQHEKAQTGVAGPPPGKHDPRLARLTGELNEHVHDRALKYLGPDPSGAAPEVAQLVSYEHVQLRPDGTGDGTQGEEERFKDQNDIGNVGWLFQHTAALWGMWKIIDDPDSKTPGPVMVPRPKKNKEEKFFIRGWGRDKEDGYPVTDQQCIRVILQPV